MSPDALTDVDHATTVVTGLCRQSRRVLVLRGEHDDPANDAQPVMTAAQRHAWLAHHERIQARQGNDQRRMRRLTPRESEILGRLAQGDRAHHIAAHSVISISTVRTQIRAILAELEVTSLRLGRDVVALWRCSWRRRSNAG